MIRPQKEIDRILGLYEGPEPERVRAAVVKLAGDNVELISYYVSVAMVSYQDLLRCADGQTNQAPAADESIPPASEIF